MGMVWKVALRCGCVLFGLGAAPALALSLAEGLALLERTGRDVTLSSAQEQVLQSVRDLAGAARRPSVDAYARETLLSDQPAAVFGAQSVPVAERGSIAYGLRVRQLLLDFGRTDAAIRAASLELEGGRLGTAIARNRAALRFILTYLRLLRAQKLLAVQQEEVARFEAHRRDTRAMLDEGTITENDLLQAEVRLADAVQKRLQAENQQAIAAGQVNSLLLRPLGQQVAPEEIPDPPAAPAPALEEALAAAARARIELQEMRARIAAVTARRAAVRTEYLPQLFVSGGYDFVENRYQVHEGVWSLAAGVEVNLYSGGLTRDRLQQKDRELQVLERARDQLADAVALEAQEAVLALQTSRARVDAAEKAVEQAKENHRLQQLRYAEGLGTATEVLDAVSLLTTAEQNHLNARYDVTDALARLDFAVGRELTAVWGGGARSAGTGEKP